MIFCGILSLQHDQVSTRMDTASRRLRYTVSGTPGQHAAGPVPYVISRRFLRNMRLLELLSAGRLWKTLRPRSARYIALRVRPVRTKNVDRRARAVLLRVPGFIHHRTRASCRFSRSELWTRGLELDSRPDTRIGRILADSIPASRGHGPTLGAFAPDERAPPAPQKLYHSEIVTTGSPIDGTHWSISELYLADTRT